MSPVMMEGPRPLWTPGSKPDSVKNSLRSPLALPLIQGADPRQPLIPCALLLHTQSKHMMIRKVFRATLRDNKMSRVWRGLTGIDTHLLWSVQITVLLWRNKASLIPPQLPYRLRAHLLGNVGYCYKIY